ncbi:MAG: FAD-dependent oxidoreductase [Sphingomonadales bacterium]
MDRSCDVLVIGSGAAAFTAALRAAAAGREVLMVEKEEVFGGASARSGGGVWVPLNNHARRGGIEDSRAAAETYFRHQLGTRYDAAKVGAYLDHGPAMLDWVEAATSLRWQVSMTFPDYHSDAPGASQGGRVLFPEAWDAGELGAEIGRLRPVLRAARFMDMQIGVSEVPYYLTAARKPGSFLHVLKCMALRARDQIRASRTLRLTSGNALVGALAAAAFRNGVQLWTSAPARELPSVGGRVAGAIVETAEGRKTIEARLGVVLATGGFPHDGARRSQVFRSGAHAAEVWGMLPYGNSGDGIRLAESVGGVFDDDKASPVALTPLTALRSGEGRLETNPLFFNRGAPGVISVRRNGQRFVNEALSYHDWGLALLEAEGDEEEAVAWIVCDRRALRRYGLGAIKPAPFPYGHHIRSGYLKSGRTIEELAANAGIDPAGLKATIETFNGPAREGKDPAFHRGSSAYQLANGDPDHKPNPCIGPVDRPPFFAVRAFAGCVATFAGLKTNEHAQVLGRDGAPIAGLYAAGNDMASITGGDYISGGCTLGPGMTFGYIAADHLLGRAAA